MGLGFFANILALMLLRIYFPESSQMFTILLIYSFSIMLRELTLEAGL